MNVYALVPLLSVLAYSGLVAFAIRHPRGTERKAFALYLIAAGLWSFISFLLRIDYPLAEQYVLPGSRLLLLSFIWMAITYYYFVCSFVQRPGGTGVYLGAGFLLLIAVLAAFGFVPESARSSQGILEIRHGVLLYALYTPAGLVLVAACAVLLLRHKRQVTTSLARTRITYLLIGLGFVTASALSNLSDTLARYPIDHIGNLANALIISYAILRLRLLDIRVVVQKSLIYSILTIFIAATYLLLLFGLQVVFRNWSSLTSFAVAAGLALVSAFLFVPLRDFAQERVDRLFFRNAYEYRQMLATFRRKSTNVLDLQRLADEMLPPLVSVLRARWAALLLPDIDTGDLRTRFAWGDIKEGDASEIRLRRNSPLVSRVKRDGQVLREELLDTLPESEDLWKAEEAAIVQSGVKLLCPLLSRGDLTGLLVLGDKRTAIEYTEEELDVLLTMASGAALALDNALMLDSLRQQQRRAEQLLAQVVEAQERERERVAIELHDSVAQWLIQASYQTQTTGLLLSRSRNPTIHAELASIQTVIDGCLKELRRVLAGLRPPALEELGLTHALNQAAEPLRAAGVACDFIIEGTPVRLPSPVEIAVYRIVQEALNNVWKHADASRVTLRLAFGEGSLSIEVTDDGKGFNVSQKMNSAVSVGRMGLLGMKQRVESLGGSFGLKSRGGKGTTVAVKLPVSAPT